MLVALLFWLLALASTGFALLYGGRDGRRAALLILSASVLTIVASRIDHGWQQVEFARLGVDLLLLAGLYALMLDSRRWWPIWMTGFHLAAVASHLAVAIAPAFLPRMYRAIESFWAIPVLLSLMLGVAFDVRRHIRD